MANDINITINSNPGYGYKLTRTSYDVRQEINAKVIGVLKYNNKIREKLLNRNIGSYASIINDDGIGYISNVYSNETSKPISLGEEGLLGYTHVYKSDYQSKINKKYDIGELIQYYQHGSLPDKNNDKWQGLYNDYTEYIDEVFGLKMTALNMLGDLFQVDKLRKLTSEEANQEEQLTIRSILYDFLQYDNIKYAMEKTRIGTVTPNPLAALSGAVTTNINNFSGTDTRLGLISNHLYAHALKNGAQFNSLRKTRYITPSAYENFGNKLETISTIGTDFRVDDETGRLAYDFNSKVTNIEYMSLSDFESMTMIDYTRDIASSENARYRNLTRNYFLPFDGNNYSVDDKSYVLKAFSKPTVGNRVYKSWNEGDKGNWSRDIFTTNLDTAFSGYSDDDGTDGLMRKTQQLFNSHSENGIDTLIGRFHTSGNSDKYHNEVSLLQTSVTKFGMSHGRNLLTSFAYKNGYSTTTNGYNNPYCRVWTYHHQYDRINKLIRPFSTDTGIMDISILQSDWWKYGRRKGSALRLKNNSSLNRNGFPNITPTIENDTTSSIDIKKCMFSIENLAWKDIKYNIESDIKPLSNEQIGPNGGRIMWFPPYDLKFNENVTANWNGTDFIGRGEKIYTYTNTERSGTLSFVLLVDHPSILDIWKKNGASSNNEDNEQSLLRFFAGCDVLELNNLSVKKDDEDDKEKELKEKKIEYQEDNSTSDIVFYIFFPNNYTGTKDSDRDSVKYLADDYESDKGGNIKEGLYEGYLWQYPVDKDYINENLIQNQNYKDSSNFKLNKSLESVKSDKSFSDATISFNDIYHNFNTILNGRVIVGAKVQGYASNHGHLNNNNSLSDNRASFASKFVTETLKLTNITPQKLDTGIITVKDIDKNNVSGESAKRARCAKVILTTKNPPIIKSLNEAIKPINNTLKNEINVDLTINKTIDISYNTLTKKEKRQIKKAAKKYANDKEAILKDNLKSLQNSLKDEVDKINNDAKNSLISQISGFSNAKILSLEESRKKQEEYKKELEQSPEQRWDEEAQYFSMLKDNDTFLYSKIIDKIKYFSPAYHSITPEGFNSRLSFLHQCTRQGPTSSTSDSPSLHSAGNLSFGRPPICVLRIGDFYHTKIVITSLTIDYENPQWDMNQEGIGMQPMFARISLNFNFLGGSDIEAPISRLQNAVSFNYYANQSIYDNRADIGIYDEGKKTSVIQGTPWSPTII